MEGEPNFSIFVYYGEIILDLSYVDRTCQHSHSIHVLIQLKLERYDVINCNGGQRKSIL